MTRAERDASALAGLRRLVLHARDQLAATRPHLDGRLLNTEIVNEHAATLASHVLAVEVLHLVADCLPDDDPVDVKALRAELADLAQRHDVLDEELGAFMSVAERLGVDEPTDAVALEVRMAEVIRERDELLAERDQRQANTKTPEETS